MVHIGKVLDFRRRSFESAIDMRIGIIESMSHEIVKDLFQVALAPYDGLVALLHRNQKVVRMNCQKMWAEFEIGKKSVEQRFWMFFVSDGGQTETHRARQV